MSNKSKDRIAEMATFGLFLETRKALLFSFECWQAHAYMNSNEFAEYQAEDWFAIAAMEAEQHPKHDDFSI